MFHNGDLMDVENDFGTMGSVPYKYKCQALQKDNCPSVGEQCQSLFASKLTLKVLGEFPKLMIHFPDIDGGLLLGGEKNKKRILFIKIGKPSYRKSTDQKTGEKLP